MERQFLQYLLYNGFVLIRALSHGRNRKEIYWLGDLLRNVPLALDSAERTREMYQRLERYTRNDGRESWWREQYEGFYHSYPEYKPLQARPTFHSRFEWLLF